MAGNVDFITILREIRGSAAPGEQSTDGIWYELTMADKNGNAGIYGDILAKYGVVTESAGTFDQAVAILENLNVNVTTLPAGAQATSALVNGVWQIGIPIGTAGIDGIDGFTPVVAMNYSLGNLNYTVTVDGIQVTNSAIVDLDGLIDTVVDANVAVQTTLAAKQEVLDAVADAQAIADGLDANVVNKIAQLDAHTLTKVNALNVASAAEQLEISNAADVERFVYDQNATAKTTQYNDNHTTKLNEYNVNDALKIEQYNVNHVERMENLDTQYADRIVDMLNTNKILGMVDKFAAKTPTEYATFIDTVNGNYMYYLNGVLLPELVGYIVLNSTTVQLTNPIAYGDVVIQVDSKYIGEYLRHEGLLTEEMIGQPNGLAGLDGTGKVPAVQLPSYVDDVLEFANLTEFPITGETSKIYVALDTNKAYRWSGTTYIYITSGAVDSVAGKTGVVTLVKADVGLSNVDNTADAIKVVASADKLTTTRTISITGDATGSVAFDGTADVSGGLTLVNSGVTAGSYPKVTVDAKGRVTAGSALVPVDVPVLNQDTTGNAATATKLATARNISLSGDVSGTVSFDGSGDVDMTTTVADDSHLHAFTNLTSKPTTLSGYGVTDAINVSQKGVVNGVATLDASGLVPVWQLPSYVDDVLEYTNLGVFPAVGEPGKIYVALDTNKTYRWSGTVYIYITSGAVDSVAGKTGIVSLVKADVGLSNVDNTSDLLKPISTATAAEFALKAPLVSPALTGTPTAPTAAVGTSTTQLATTAFVRAEIANDTYSKADVDAANLLRADKYLAAQNIAAMLYTGSDLTKIQYNNATDVDYELLTYTSGNLTSIQHYIGSVLKGTTTLTYSSGTLVSAVFAGV